MSRGWSLLWEKMVAFFTDLFHWFYPHNIAKDEPMEFRFVRIRQRKVRYDIKKEFLTFSVKTKDDGFKYSFFFLMLALLFLMPYLSRNVGVSTREWQQNEYSEAVYRHFHDGDESYKTMQPYATKGQLADILVVSVCKYFGFDNVFRIKHRLSALFGCMLIFVLGMFCARIISWRCAFFCSLFLFCSPRFLGYTLGNFNDTLFALAFFFTLIQIWRFCNNFPIVKWKRLLAIFMGMLVATTTSLSGFSLIFFFSFFSILYFLVKNPIRKIFTRQYLASLLTLIMIIGSTALAVLLLNIILSPGFSLSDLRNGDNSLQMFVATSQQLPQFFDGNMISSEDVPANYVIRSIFITTPFVVILGLLLSVVFFRTIMKEFSLFTVFVLLFTFFYMLSAFSARYVGSDIVCSVIFMLMPFVVIVAAMGYEATLRKVDDRYTNPVIVALALFLTCLPLRHIILNRPLTLCYFNEVSGGIHNAAERYDLELNSQSSVVAEKWFTQYYTIQKDSLIQSEWQRKDSLLAMMDSLEIQALDSSFYQLVLDTPVVYTNGNPAFCSFLQGNNPDLKVVYATIHSLNELPGDYYILFGNQTDLFKHTENAFHTIDLERVPIVSFFKKEKKVDTVGNILTNQESIIIEMNKMNKNIKCKI